MCTDDTLFDVVSEPIRLSSLINFFFIILETINGAGGGDGFKANLMVARGDFLDSLFYFN